MVLQVLQKGNIASRKRKQISDLNYAYQLKGNKKYRLKATIIPSKAINDLQNIFGGKIKLVK